MGSRAGYEKVELGGGGKSCASDAYLASATRTSDGKGANPGLVTSATDESECVASDYFAPDRTDKSVSCTDKSGAKRCFSARHYPCDGVHTHGFVYRNEWRSTRCVRRQIKAVRCEGPFYDAGSCGSQPTVECGAGGPHSSGIYEYK